MESMEIIMGLQDEGLRHNFLRLVRPDTPPAVENVPTHGIVARGHSPPLSLGTHLYGNPRQRFPAVRPT